MRGGADTRLGLQKVKNLAIKVQKNISAIFGSSFAPDASSEDGHWPKPRHSAVKNKTALSFFLLEKEAVALKNPLINTMAILTVYSSRQEKYIYNKFELLKQKHRTDPTRQL